MYRAASRRCVGNNSSRLGGAPSSLFPRSNGFPGAFHRQTAALSYFNRFKQSADDVKNKAKESVKGSESAQKFTGRIKIVSDAIGKVLESMPAANEVGSIVKTELTKMVYPEKKVFSKREKEEVMRKHNSSTASAGDPESAKTSALLNVEQPKTAWERLKETFVGSKVYKSTEPLRKSVLDSSVYKSTEKVQEKIQDKVEDIREVYETSQNPIVWNVREVADTVLEESDDAAAMREIKRFDPQFTLDTFLQEMEQYMIPKVIKAFRQADMELLRTVCEGNALRNVIAEASKRQALSWILDDQILDTSHIEFHDCMFLDGNEPIIRLTFICQHVDCVRDFQGKIVEGSESKIQAVHYTWLLRQEHECPDFNYRIVDMGVQGIAGLL